MKTGLILEGGAMRAMFTCGVIDVMLEHHISFDGAIGVSAGASFGCNYKSGQIGRPLRYNMKYCNDSRYCSIRSLITTGDLYNKEFCYNEVPLILDPFDIDAYKANPMKFYIVCTDINTGKPVYHQYDGLEDHGLDWFRASSSLPFVAKIVEIDGQKLLDGGISDPIPIRFMENQRYDKNIVILTQPQEYVKKKIGLMPLIRWKYKKYPKLIEALEHRHLLYNETISYICEQEALGKLLVIRPDCKLPVARIEKNPHKLKEAYDIGRRIASARITEIIAFLK
ncbi:MAG: patatin family protein [Phascolarctobacterium sp.]|nr:patatin family protein [Phascolarctobacterium sp.]